MGDGHHIPRLMGTGKLHLELHHTGRKLPAENLLARSPVVSHMIGRAPGAAVQLQEILKAGSAPVLSQKGNLPIFHLVGELLCINGKDQLVFPEAEDFSLGEEGPVIVNGQIGDRDVLGTIYHKGDYLAVKDEIGPAAVHRQVSAPDEGEGNAFEALVVVGDEVVFFEGAIGIDMVGSLGKAQGALLVLLCLKNGVQQDGGGIRPRSQRLEPLG